MNQVGAQRAIRKLIQDYADILVSGFVHQGEQREIEDVVLSVMTAPRAFYFICVEAANARSQSFGGNAGTEGKPQRVGLYELSVHVVDAALSSGDENEEPYELMHSDFRTLCDRIEAMVCGDEMSGTYAAYFTCLPLCIPDPESTSEYRLLRQRGTDRSVRVLNLDTEWQDPNTQQWTPIFYSQIQFSLEEWV